jgi:hypothetical protein
VEKVTLMHREAIGCMNHDDGDEDWVADVSNRVGHQIELGAIFHCIAKPERRKRRGELSLVVCKL